MFLQLLGQGQTQGGELLLRLPRIDEFMDANTSEGPSS